MIMKTYQLDNKPNMLGFTNYQRIDEEELFNGILSCLQDNPDVEIGVKKTGPSEDSYHCSLSGSSFTLLYDIDYGASIYCDKPDTMQELIRLFEAK